jgi:glucose-1-phosphate cytidylyltransferase
MDSRSSQIWSGPERGARFARRSSPAGGEDLAGMRSVVLAGGFGSRLAEETVVKPKPMVEIGGRPIILHIMDVYARYGCREFIIACGYKGEYIKQFFGSYFLNHSDFTLSLRDGSHRVINGSAPDWTVSVIDTGAATLTGGRLRRLKPWLADGTFLATYGDGVADIDVAALVRFHRRHGKLATVTAVQPPARFGNLELDGDQVREFTEKVQKHETWINGGFFVFEPEVLDYIEGDQIALEGAPLARLASDGELMAYKHHGFWHPMDTVRDRNHLEQLVKDGQAPWIVQG